MYDDGLNKPARSPPEAVDFCLNTHAVYGVRILQHRLDIGFHDWTVALTEV